MVLSSDSAQAQSSYDVNVRPNLQVTLKSNTQLFVCLLREILINTVSITDVIVAASSPTEITLQSGHFGHESLRHL